MGQSSALFWNSLVIPAAQKPISPKERLFSDSQLWQMMVPLFIEQILVVALGIADTFMVSFLGEAEVSGVALVDQVNLIFLYILIALSSCGAVIVSQYLGAGDRENGNCGAGQLLSSAAFTGISLAALAGLFYEPFFSLLFGNVEPPVMAAAAEYMKICLFSYPALGIYHAGAAIQRSLGNTSCTMKISAASNGINIIGNILGLFVFHAGIAGVAVPTVLARWFSAIVVTMLTFSQERPVYYEWKMIFSCHRDMIRRILAVAIPNAIENGFFQLMKVLLVGIVALFGTSQMAANGVAQSIWSLAAMFGVTMGYVYVTVIGRCMGAGMKEAAAYYFRKLSHMTLGLSVFWNLLVLIAAFLALQWYPLTEETRQLVLVLVVLHNLCNAFFFPFSQPLAFGLRAAGDVKVPMYITIFATFCRVALSVILGIWLDMGVVGVTLAMCLDWLFRALLMVKRWQEGAWETKQLI